MPRGKVRRQSYLLVYGCLAVLLILLHEPLLQLPYFWDELGQFIPASLDLFETGAWIPHSTLPNIHPPGLMAYLAAVWHVFGYSIVATRVAMLLLAALGALLTFLLAIELSRGFPGTPAFAAVALLCVSPLFVSQSILAQLDLPAMCFTVLALLLFLQNEWRNSALACVALVLFKETGIVAPALFGGWLLAERRSREACWFLLPLVVLCLWLVALKAGTGHWMGNKGFTEYNLYYPLNPVRFVIALLRRIYYLFFATGHFIGTALWLSAFAAIPMFRDRAWRIAFSLLAAHTIAVTALGGAVLERYLLPVLPIVYVAFAIALYRKKAALIALLACLIAANFINPIYPFPFENNLAFVSFVSLQEQAAAAVDGRPGTLATTFPMSDAFRRPEFGFALQKRPVRLLQGFRAADIAPLTGNPPDAMIVYDTAWDPLHILTTGFANWVLTKYYGYQPALSADEIARRLSMRVEHRWRLHGLSMSLLVR